LATAPLLLVDRCPAVGDRLAAALAVRKLDFLRVSTSPRALAACRQGVLGVFLVREGLPRALSRALRQAAEGSPIVLVGPREARFRRRALASGMHDYLPVSWTEDEFETALDRLPGEGARLQAWIRATLREQAARRLENLGSFAAGVVQELAGPLDALGRLAGLVQRALEQDRLGEARKHLDRLEVSARAVDALLKDLRSFARAQKEQTGTRPLGALLAEAARLATESVPEGPPVTVRCSRPAWRIPGDLRTVVRNLVVRARRASPHRPVRLTGELRPSGALRIRVRDHGPGLPAGPARAAGDPLPSSKDGVNLGLGLAIARLLAERQRAEIRFRSKAGVGTLATLVLPPSAVEPPRSRVA